MIITYAEDWSEASANQTSGFQAPSLFPMVIDRLPVLPRDRTAQPTRCSLVVFADNEDMFNEDEWFHRTRECLPAYVRDDVGIVYISPRVRLKGSWEDWCSHLMTV